jgi:hypothetical protein
MPTQVIIGVHDVNRDATKRVSDFFAQAGIWSRMSCVMGNGFLYKSDGYFFVVCQSPRLVSLLVHSKQVVVVVVRNSYLLEHVAETLHTGHIPPSSVTVGWTNFV